MNLHIISHQLSKLLFRIFCKYDKYMSEVHTSKLPITLKKKLWDRTKQVSGPLWLREFGLKPSCSRIPRLKIKSLPYMYVNCIHYEICNYDSDKKSSHRIRMTQFWSSPSSSGTRQSYLMNCPPIVLPWWLSRDHGVFKHSGGGSLWGRRQIHFPWNWNATNIILLMFISSTRCVYCMMTRESLCNSCNFFLQLLTAS